jgi:hypothetical protein
MARGMAQWFTAEIPQEDRFVAPDFKLGQFFYSAETARRLVDSLDRFARPCCLCTPRLAFEWHRRGRTVRLLDCDRRFASLPGFTPFDLLRPKPAGESFDVVIFDPVFADARILRRALETALGLDEGRPRPALFMTFPDDREAELLSAFPGWNLARLDLPLLYNNVRRDCGAPFRLYGTEPLGSVGD